MNTFEAAKLLISMISDLRMAGYDDDSYHEAVAIAVAALMIEKDVNNG